MKFLKRKSHTPDDEEFAWQARHKDFLEALPADVRGAAGHTTDNRGELSKSDIAGCYYCLSIFKPAAIWEWIHPGKIDEFPMCPYCGIDSVFGDASGYPVTKDFLREMNKYWFNGEGESINKETTERFSRYGDKILGIRNYEAEKDEFYATDFINRNTLYDFMWEVSDGESDFTPAGIVFLNEYFDFQELASQFRQSGKQLPPHGEGQSEKERISKFIDYMKNVEPMETALFIAEAQWGKSNQKGNKPSIENIDDRFLPPEREE